MRIERSRKNHGYQWLGFVVMMKKFLFSSILIGMMGLANANDFVHHSSNKATALPTTGKQIQVLNFWATWCGPCRREMPAMSQWYEQKGKKQKIAMIGIALDQPQNITQFLKTTPVSYPIWRYTGNDSRQLMQSYGNKIGGYPYTVVRVPNCKTAWTTVGELSISRLEKSIEGVKKACLQA